MGNRSGVIYKRTSLWPCISSAVVDVFGRRRASPSSLSANVVQRRHMSSNAGMFQNATECRRTSPNVAERRAARRANVAELRRNVAERRRTSPNESPNVLSRRRTSSRVTRVASIVITCRRSSRVPCHVSGPLSAILYERCNTSGSLMRS